MFKKQTYKMCGKLCGNLWSFLRSLHGLANTQQYQEQQYSVNKKQALSFSPDFAPFILN